MQEIFQGDIVCHVLFVVAMIPLTLLFMKTKISYQLKKGGERISHLLFIDYLKLLTKSEDEFENLINTVTIFSHDIKMEFGLS